MLLVCAGALADDWPGPQIKEVFSEGRDDFVRVAPGQSWGDSVGFEGAPKGPFAKAEFYHRRTDGSYSPGALVSLVNPVAPVDFFVSNEGYLATLDNWHSMGYGKVFALYSPGGSLIQSYELRDLFSEDEIQQFEHSVSSIWWRKGPAYLQIDQKSLYVTVDEKGGALAFDARTGRYRFCEWHEKAFACRASAADRKWEPY